MFLHTNTFTIDIVPLVLEVHYFAGVILEYKGIIVKYAIKQSAKEPSKIPPTHQNRAEHHRGSNPGPASSPPEQGGGQRGQPRCARTPTTFSWTHPLQEVAWRHAEAV